MSALLILSVGPQVTVQDAGRSGGLGLGLSRGGAADRAAYLMGCALLGQGIGTACVEMAGMGGRFQFDAPTRFALSGAPMRATLNGASLEWNAAHLAGPGQTLVVGSAVDGTYGYLSVGGGIATEPALGGRAYHGIAGLGKPLDAGDSLPLAPDPKLGDAPMRYRPPAQPRGPIRVMPGPQTAFFSDEMRRRFEATIFRRSARANRQGVGMESDGASFASGAQLSQVSDFIAEGDVQMTGDGTPYVLLVDCQTMGGYPRIGSVLPVDLPRVAQALPGAEMSFRFMSLDEAEGLYQSDEDRLAACIKQLEPRTRDPREMADLLAYDLIDKPGREVTE